MVLILSLMDSRQSTRLVAVSWRVAVLFLQSRPVVLDWVHTPGEHAQCHKTRNSHIENFHFLFGLMAAGSLLHSMQESMISL